MVNVINELFKICDVKYFINEEKRTVVCKLVTRGDFEVRGIAKCSPVDTFSSDIGKKVAYLKAKRQLLIIHKNLIKDLFIKPFSRKYESLQAEADSCKRKISEETDII